MSFRLMDRIKESAFKPLWHSINLIYLFGEAKRLKNNMLLIQFLEGLR